VNIETERESEYRNGTERRPISEYRNGTDVNLNIETEHMFSSISKRSVILNIETERNGCESESRNEYRNGTERNECECESRNEYQTSLFNVAVPRWG